jgi:hypothetical protein
MFFLENIAELIEKDDSKGETMNQLNSDHAGLLTRKQYKYKKVPKFIFQSVRLQEGFFIHY